jgi:hypothetical protein
MFIFGGYYESNSIACKSQIGKLSMVHLKNNLSQYNGYFPMSPAGGTSTFTKNPMREPSTPTLL